MTDDELRLLADIHTGLPPSFDRVWFEAVDGTRVQACLHADDLPGDPRTLIDAVPGLAAENKELRELKSACQAIYTRALALQGSRSWDETIEDEFTRVIGPLLEAS